MAIQAVNVFLKYTEEFSQETKQLIARYGSPLTWEGFYFDTTPADSKKINDSHYPMIIVSSSGMCTGGRILHHLMQRLPDPRNLVLFIGFQSPGTRGAMIKGGAKEVKMFGDVVTVRAQVAALEQFSDHADTPELLEWLHTFKNAPAQTYLVHGEPAAAAALQTSMTQELRWHVEVAQYMQQVPLPATWLC
jgi:metallo-beta-lactamase family protein